MKPCPISDLPVLTEDEKDDAAFRIRDRLWAEIADLYDKYREENGLSFAVLGRRIGRSRSQVQRWLSAPMNMTLASAGLLVEGLNAEPDLCIRPRSESLSNRAHPCDEAAAQLVYMTYVKNASTPDVDEDFDDLSDPDIDLEAAMEKTLQAHYEIA